MDFEIYLNFKHDKYYDLDFEEKVIPLCFYSYPELEKFFLEDYFHFHDFFKIEDYDKKEQKLLFKLEKKINNHIPEFHEYLKSLKLTILNIQNPQDLTLIPPYFSMVIDLDNRSIKEVLEFINNPSLKSNYLFLDKYNDIEPVDKEVLNYTYTCIENISNFYKQFNLSPAELVFCFYDYVRNHIYRLYHGENKAIGRDLNKIVDAKYYKYRVCGGYVNFFGALLEEVGIKNEYIGWNSDKTYGHASTLVYLNDAKYNIRSPLAFDLTWDAKKNNFDQNFINNCQFAFLPLEIEKSIKYQEKQNYYLDRNSTWYNFEKYYHLLQKFVQRDDPNIMQKRAIELFIKEAQKIYHNLGITLKTDKLLYNVEEAKAIYQNLTGLVNKINPATFKLLCTNVDKIEKEINALYHHSKRIEKLIASNLALKK